LTSKPIPKFRIIDNGQKVLTKENIEELVVEPVYKGDNTPVPGSYALLTPTEFSSMTDDELKEWYKNNKNKKK
jgi:hypothetical protein